MTKYFFLLLLFGSLLLVKDKAQAAETAPGITLSFPSSGVYTYWVQDKSGVIPNPPVTVVGSKSVQTSKPIESGDTVMVLDSRTGKIAVQTVSVKTHGALVSIVLLPQDFKPLVLSFAAESASTPTTPASTTPVASAVPPIEHPENSGLRVFALLLGWIAAGFVIWLIVLLIRSRGTLLISLARQAGVEVPDPTHPGPDLTDLPVTPLPAVRPRIEKIPEEAGMAPDVSQFAPRPHSTVSSGVINGPQLVGVQGLAAGTTFAITDFLVTIGREGDNTIVLAESTVSRHHARLERQPNGRVAITDLGSGNGVIINGIKTDSALLTSGDDVKIGDNYFRFEE